jgi:hypothetical protein
MAGIRWGLRLSHPEGRQPIGAFSPKHSHAEVLSALIRAFDNFYFYVFGGMPEVEAHIGHPDPRIRRDVAHALSHGLDAATSTPRTALLLNQLGSDNSGMVRAAALIVLRDHAPHSPITHRLLTAGGEDPDPTVRLDALFGLAQRGDTPAAEHLQQLADEAGEHSHAW